jgi:hypothetical protein
MSIAFSGEQPIDHGAAHVLISGLELLFSGLIVHHFGYSSGFVSLACEGLVALVVLALCLLET